ncbi:MAG: hypothetical protein ACKO40_07585 [Planctomycetaceae bacterium]
MSGRIGSTPRRDSDSRSQGAAWVLIVLAAVLAGGGGCSSASAPPAARKAVAVTLGPIDPESAITVDGGRLCVRSPLGWSRSPRSDDYLVRYTPGQQKTFPAIVVTAADAPDGLTDVTTDNHGDFVAAVTQDLAATFSRDGRSTLLKKPTAVKLGDRLGVAWTAPGTAKVGGLKQPIERSCVAVVVAGRLVTVEARAPKGKLDDEGLAAARGVAAALVPPTPADAPPEEPASAPPAE